jgi:hypothetical protein
MSLPGVPTSGPVSLPGQRRSPGPVLASSLPTNRTDFKGPDARDAALQRARELARTVVGDLEELEGHQVYGDKAQQGSVTYFRGRGSTSVMGVDNPLGNIVVIVEHTQDPSQPPHFHVVRPPSIGKRIEHGGVYLEIFEGTPDQHLTYWQEPAGKAVRDPAAR